MPKGKYSAADVAPDPNAASLPNAGPMGKYSAEDVADAPVTDDSSIGRYFGGAADRVKSIAASAQPQGIDEILGGPGYKMVKGVVQGMGTAYDSAKAAAERGDTTESMFKSVAAGVPIFGPGAVSIYDRAKPGDTAGAMGMGTVDALAMLLPTKGGKVADVAGELADHPAVRGTGRVIRDFDITKPFKSIGENVVAPAAEKLSQMRAARGKPTLQSPLDPDAGVKVAPGGPIEQPRIPSPAEDMVSSLEQGKSEIPVGPIQDTAAPRSMQPTADMTTGAGGANYSADDLANLIQRHNIPPAPGEIVGGAPESAPTEPAPQIKSRWWHGTNTDALPGIAEHGLTRAEFGEGDFGPGPFLTDNASVAKDYALQDPNSGAGRVLLGVDVPVEETKVAEPTVRPFAGGDEDFIANELDAQRTIHPSEISEVRHLQRTGYPEVSDDAGILQAMREDLDAHGRNALHEESTNFAARNKVGKGKTGKPGYGFNRRLPEAE